MTTRRDPGGPALGARALLAALLAVAVTAPAGAQPRLVRAEEAGLVLTSLPALLDDDGVAPHLDSGLTTGMILRVEGRGKELLGGARIEIRYELWDEQYLLSALGADGRVVSATLDTRAALAAWWAAAEIPVVAIADATAVPSSVRVVLEIVPFSRAEQDDTQRWFSETVHRGGISSDDRAKSADQGGDALEKVFSVLIATSIQRRPLESFSWEVDVPGNP
jgi:hypothetical protein